MAFCIPVYPDLRLPTDYWYARMLFTRTPYTCAVTVHWYKHPMVLSFAVTLNWTLWMTAHRVVVIRVFGRAPRPPLTHHRSTHRTSARPTRTSVRLACTLRAPVLTTQNTLSRSIRLTKPANTSSYTEWVQLLHFVKRMVAIILWVIAIITHIMSHCHNNSYYESLP